MNFPVELQAQILEYLPRDVLYHLAGPRGLGIVAFNSLHRHLTVVSPSEAHEINERIGTPDFAMKAADWRLDVEHLLAFCETYPYFRPHTLEFGTFDQYMKAVWSAPELLQTATRLVLNSYRYLRDVHMQLVSEVDASLETPGLFTNIRHYSCVSTHKIEYFAKNLQRHLPQLESLDFEYRGPYDDNVQRNYCYLEHPNLRKLKFLGPNWRAVEFVIIKLPVRLQHLETKDASAWFVNAFQFDQSPITSLKASPPESIRFPDRGPGVFPKLTTLNLCGFHNAEAYYDFIKLSQLQSLEISYLEFDDFKTIQFSPTLTKLDLEFEFDWDLDDEIIARDVFAVPFKNELLLLRELSLKLRIQCELVNIVEIFGQFPDSLEKLALTNCCLDPQESGIENLHNLEFLHLELCTYKSKLPSPKLKLPPGLKKLTFFDNFSNLVIEYNSTLESLKCNIRNGRKYHNLPDLHTFVIRSILSEFSPPLRPNTITFPSTLTSLDIKYADCSKLELPPSLVNLKLVNCRLTQFPALPRLQSLNIANNEIQLPRTIPPRLRWLNVYGNRTSGSLNWSKSNLRFLVSGNHRIRVPMCPEMYTAKY